MDKPKPAQPIKNRYQFDRHQIFLARSPDSLTITIKDTQTFITYFLELLTKALPEPIKMIFDGIANLHRALVKLCEDKELVFEDGEILLAYVVSVSGGKKFKTLGIKMERLKPEEIQDLKRKLVVLGKQREKMAKERTKLEKEAKQQRQTIANLQSRLNIFVFSKGRPMQFAFEEAEVKKADYVLKGQYLQRLGNNGRQFADVRSSGAINDFAEKVVSYSMEKVRGEGKIEIGLLADTQHHNFRQKHTLRHSKFPEKFNTGDVLTMTVDKQKECIMWFVNKQSFGREPFKMEQNIRLVPFIQLSPGIEVALIDQP